MDIFGFFNPFDGSIYLQQTLIPLSTRCSHHFPALFPLPLEINLCRIAVDTSLRIIGKIIVLNWFAKSTNIDIRFACNAFVSLFRPRLHLLFSICRKTYCQTIQ